MVVPVFWRTQKQRYSLQAEVCPHCSSTVFPSRSVCPYCRHSMATSPAAVQPNHAAPAAREFVFARNAAPVALTAAAQAAAGDD